MKLLLIGSGAREHAISKALKGAKLFNIASHINPGILALAEDIKIIPFENKKAICDFAKKKKLTWS